MQVVFAISLLYLACFGFYHADPRRTGFEYVRKQRQLKAWLQLAAWAASAAALFVVADLIGWERGIPVWLGLFMCAGVTSLFVAAVNVRRHVLSGVVFLFVLITSGMLLSVRSLA